MTFRISTLLGHVYIQIQLRNAHTMSHSNGFFFFIFSFIFAFNMDTHGRYYAFQFVFPKYPINDIAKRNALGRKSMVKIEKCIAVFLDFFIDKHGICLFLFYLIYSFRSLNILFLISFTFSKKKKIEMKKRKITFAKLS